MPIKSFECDLIKKFNAEHEQNQIKFFGRWFKESL